MSNSKQILLQIGLALASMSITNVKTITRKRGIIVIKPNKKPTVAPKKAIKPKGKNYTSKMKMKPNTVRKDFNQRRR